MMQSEAEPLQQAVARRAPESELVKLCFHLLETHLMRDEIVDFLEELSDSVTEQDEEYSDVIYNVMDGVVGWCHDSCTLHPRNWEQGTFLGERPDGF